MSHSASTFDHPLYDPAAPIACSIEAAELPDHVTLIERLRINLQSIERTTYGVLLRLPNTAENAADLRQFAALEKQCCPFWGFEVIGQPDLTLRWDGPPELADYMSQLVEYFEGRAPIGSLLGSL